MPRLKEPADRRRNQIPLWMNDADEWALNRAVEEADISRNQWLTDAVREKIERQSQGESHGS